MAALLLGLAFFSVQGMESYLVHVLVVRNWVRGLNVVNFGVEVCSSGIAVSLYVEDIV